MHAKEIASLHVTIPVRVLCTYWISIAFKVWSADPLPLLK